MTMKPQNLYTEYCKKKKKKEKMMEGCCHKGAPQAIVRFCNFSAYKGSVKTWAMSSVFGWSQ